MALQDGAVVDPDVLVAKGFVVALGVEQASRLSLHGHDGGREKVVLLRASRGYRAGTVGTLEWKKGMGKQRGGSNSRRAARASVDFGARPGGSVIYNNPESCFGLLLSEKLSQAEIAEYHAAGLASSPGRPDRTGTGTAADGADESSGSSNMYVSAKGAEGGTAIVPTVTAAAGLETLTADESAAAAKPAVSNLPQRRRWQAVPMRCAVCFQMFTQDSNTSTKCHGMPPDMIPKFHPGSRKRCSKAGFSLVGRWAKPTASSPERWTCCNAVVDDESRGCQSLHAPSQFHCSTPDIVDAIIDATVRGEPLPTSWHPVTADGYARAPPVAPRPRRELKPGDHASNTANQGHGQHQPTAAPRPRKNSVPVNQCPNEYTVLDSADDADAESPNANTIVANSPGFCSAAPPLPRSSSLGAESAAREQHSPYSLPESVALSKLWPLIVTDGRGQVVLEQTSGWAVPGYNVKAAVQQGGAVRQLPEEWWIECSDGIRSRKADVLSPDILTELAAGASSLQLTVRYCPTVRVTVTPVGILGYEAKPVPVELSVAGDDCTVQYAAAAVCQALQLDSRIEALGHCDAMVDAAHSTNSRAKLLRHVTLFVGEPNENPPPPEMPLSALQVGEGSSLTLTLRAVANTKRRFNRQVVPQYQQRAELATLRRRGDQQQQMIVALEKVVRKQSDQINEQQLQAKRQQQLIDEMLSRMRALEEVALDVQLRQQAQVPAPPVAPPLVPKRFLPCRIRQPDDVMAVNTKRNQLQLDVPN